MAYNPNNPNGQAVSASSQPVVIASDQSQVSVFLPDLFVTGASAQTATVNNILTVSSGANATDLAGYKAASVQVVSTGTGGTFIFEGSNDNVNFQAVIVYSQLILTGTPITAAITASASQLIYTIPLHYRYFRLRIATAITGGSIQAFSRFTQETWVPGVFQVAQATGTNLNVGTVTTTTTVGTVTNGNSGFPGTVADVASAAITTTTTTAAFTPTFGSCYQINIPVTAVSGTTPTLDVQIQESADAGTNWYAVYDFPRITATGSYNSPPMALTGNRVRYVQTVNGTTPSFTRAINRLQTSNGAPPIYRQQYDRTITLTTLNSTTAVLYTEGASTNLALLEVNIGATTIAPVLQLQGSNDNTNWNNIGTPVTAVASSTAFAFYTGQQWKFMRAQATTAGTGTTAGYVFIKAC